MLDALIASAVLMLPSDDHREPRPSRATVSRIVQAASLPPARWRAFAQCVEQRESGGNPAARNPSGAAGLFQFMPDWQNGLPYMVAERLRDHGLPHAQARKVRIELSGTPIHRWPAIYQRVGFAQAISIPGNDKHWALAGSRCEAFR